MALNPYMGSYDDVEEGTESFYELCWYDMMDECYKRVNKLKWSNFVSEMHLIIRGTAMEPTYEKSYRQAEKLLNLISQFKPKKLSKQKPEYFRNSLLESMDFRCSSDEEVKDEERLRRGKKTFWDKLRAMSDFRHNADLLAERWNSTEELFQYVQELERKLSGYDSTT